MFLSKTLTYLMIILFKIINNRIFKTFPLIISKLEILKFLKESRSTNTIFSTPQPLFVQPLIATHFFG